MKFLSNAKVKVILMILIFIVLFAAVNLGLGFLTNDDTLYFSRVSINEMYEDKDIDTIFLGSSVCFYAFNPEYIDEKLGTHSFNLATMHQGMDGSYALLKEAGKSHELKTVYLDLFCSIPTLYENKKRVDLTSTYLISDYMKPSIDRVKYCIDASNRKHYFNTFLLSRRNANMLLEPAAVTDLLKKKLTKTYLSGGLIYKDTKPNEYASKGYVYNYKALKTEGNLMRFGDHNPINVDKLSKDWIKAFDGIVEYCEEHNIKLVLVATPLSNFRICNVGNYDEYIDFINERIKGKDVEYYDFNLLKDDVFADTTTYYSDDHHLSLKGTKAFQSIFTDLMSGKVTRSDVMYDTVKEKFEKMTPNVFGLIVNKRDEAQLTFKPVTNITSGKFDYEVIVMDGDQNELWTFDSREDDIILGDGVTGEITYCDSGRCIVKIITYVDGELKATTIVDVKNE